MTKLNLGCGYNKLDGYINVDHDENCNPDIVADLESILPFEDSSIDEIVLHHILEHLGHDVKTYFNLWKELYRILKNDGLIRITVPHHLHENFHHDPTHCRKITPNGIDMFNQARNQHTIDTGGNETTLGIQLGIDIRVTEVGYDLMPWFQEEMQYQPREAIERELNRRNNACYQVQINAIAVK